LLKKEKKKKKRKKLRIPSSGIEETDRQQEASRYTEGKMAFIHINSKVPLSIWIRTPPHWKSAFGWGATTLLY